MSQLRRFAPIFAIFLLAVMFILVFVFTRNIIVTARENRFDFYPRYVGTQAFWDGTSPYETSVTRAIQMGMFGGELPEGMDQQRFAYPAYTALFLAPFLALPAPEAIALWMTIQFFGILGSIIIWLIILDYQPKPIAFFAAVFLSVFVFKYPVNA